MKKITKFLILSAGIGAVIYMTQMGERDNRKLKELLNDVNPFNRYKNKENDKKKQEKVFVRKKEAKPAESVNIPAEESEDSSSVIEVNQKTVEEELQDGKELFSYLLPLTKKGTEIKETDKALDYGYVIQNWKDALAGDCELLKAEFDSLLQESGIALDEINSEEAAIVFSKWLDYLENLGIHEYSDESLDENGNVTVSVKNRKFYINGRNFKDGLVCAVEKNPWLYNDELYYKGILCDIVKDTEEIISMNVETVQESAKDEETDDSEEDK